MLRGQQASFAIVLALSCVLVPSFSVIEHEISGTAEIVLNRAASRPVRALHPRRRLFANAAIAASRVGS